MSIFKENISPIEKNNVLELLTYLNSENKLIRGKLAVERELKNKIVDGLLIIPCSISPIDLVIHMPAFCTEERKLQAIFIDEKETLKGLSSSKTLSCAYLIKKESVPEILLPTYAGIEKIKNYF